MRYARTLKIVDHDGTAYHYENVLYREDSAGLHIHYTVTWGMADIERMEVDCGGQDQQAAYNFTYGDGDAPVESFSGVSLTGPYDTDTGRPAQGPLDDEPEPCDGC